MKYGQKSHVRGSYSSSHFLFNCSRGTTRIDGYSKVGREVLENDLIVECKESFDITSPDTKFPQETPQWKFHAKAMALQSLMLGKRLLHCMASDLGADPNEFLQHHDKMFYGNANATCLRILRYPAQHLAGLASGPITRCGEHTDYGGLTLLYQVTGIHWHCIKYAESLSNLF